MEKEWWKSRLVWCGLLCVVQSHLAMLLPGRIGALLGTYLGIAIVILRFDTTKPIARINPDKEPHPTIIHGLLGGLVLGAAIVIAALLSGCSTINQPLDQNVFYRRDMKLKVNGVEANGAMVIPKSDKYDIIGNSEGRLDLVILTSCHREWSAEDQGNQFEYIYQPSKGLEDSVCPISVIGLDRKHGKHSWAFLDFQDDQHQLPATLKCNGSTTQSTGVSICQSAQGLLEEIDFPAEVIVDPDKNCPLVGAQSRGTSFQFRINARECVYEFMEVAEPHRAHRLNTLGYQQIILMEN